MKKFILSVAALSMALAASAQETPASVKVGGFIRTYAHIDTKDMISGRGDLFSYIPLEAQSDNGNTYHLTAMTSRLWVKAEGYRFGNMTASAKIEADFYNGVTGVTISDSRTPRVKRSVHSR